MARLGPFPDVQLPLWLMAVRVSAGLEIASIA